MSEYGWPRTPYGLHKLGVGIMVGSACVFVVNAVTTGEMSNTLGWWSVLSIMFGAVLATFAAVLGIREVDRAEKAEKAAERKTERGDPEQVLHAIGLITIWSARNADRLTAEEATDLSVAMLTDHSYTTPVSLAGLTQTLAQFAARWAGLVAEARGVTVEAFLATQGTLLAQWVEEQRKETS